MKLTYREIESFVKTPDKAARVILVYGPDNGLMKERAKTIGLSVVSDLSDPFNVAVLSSSILTDDPARLADEAGAISMMGGDRLIRVEDAAAKIAPLVKEYLANPNPHALIVLEAGELGPRSALRKLCESAKNAAAVPCYVEDERDVSRLIRAALQEAGLSTEPDAVAFLAAAIAGDRQRARSEMDKLVLYKGADRSAVTLADAQACCGSTGESSLDELTYAVAGRQPEAALRSYARLIEEGVNFVVILRALQNHFRRLHLTRAKVEAGESAVAAVKSLYPPIFFKQEAAFSGQVQGWSLRGLNKILERLADLEAQCKTTGMPVETLCGQVILGISASRRS
ncbi:MAG: DNA polymerase III subunit delta [Alphaproteobacteria bacterium]|nr:DNA polymerase III subunit delta [Alphaproteobacteria bacterium]